MEARKYIFGDLPCISGMLAGAVFRAGELVLKSPLLFSVDPVPTARDTQGDLWLSPQL